jgi:hypothetical protein
MLILVTNNQKKVFHRAPWIVPLDSAPAPSFPGSYTIPRSVEVCLAVAGFVIAIFIRLGTDEGSILLEYEQGFLKIFVVLVVFIICMHYFDLYASSTICNGREIFIRMVQALGTQSVILALFYYAYPNLRLGRGIFILGFSVVAVMLFSVAAAFSDAEFAVAICSEDVDSRGWPPSRFLEP